MASVVQGVVEYAAFVNYAVDRRALAPLVPQGLDLDLFDGVAWVSLVAFHFADNRLFGIPIPFARSYDQVSFRFYVKRRLPDGGVRHGVVFLREIIPVSSIAAGARLFYGERYERHPVSSRVRDPEPAARAGRAVYRWREQRQVHRLALDFSGVAEVPAAGSLEEFLVERHWGYAARAAGTVEYRVDHAPWRVWHAEAARLSGDAAQSFGDRFARVLSAPPASAFVAEGSRMWMHRPTMMAGTAVQAHQAPASMT